MEAPATEWRCSDAQRCSGTTQADSSDMDMGGTTQARARGTSGGLHCGTAETCVGETEDACTGLRSM